MSSVSSVNSLLSSTSSNTASTVNVSSILAAVAGVSTPGIDVNAAVASALYAARAPERIWQAEQTTLNNQTAALTSIQTAVKTLSADVSALNSLTGPLAARSVTSSAAGAVTATAASGTNPGNHTVTVGNLAQTASWYSDVAAAPGAALPATTFTISTATGTATLSTGSGVNTLDQLAASINSKNLGVTASVISDAAGSRLAIVSNSSGSGGDFSITSANSSGTTWSSPAVPSGGSLGANSFHLTTTDPVSGDPVMTTITTTAGESLSAVAADINGRGLGVTASVTSDATGSHLTIASNDGTTPFTIDEPSLGFSQAAQGLNASLTVDGVPVSSASNTVTGTIGGVTLYLQSPTGAGQVNLSVRSDTTQIANALTTLVSDYNTAIGLVNAQFNYNGSSQGVLGSDPLVRSLQSSLMQVLGYVQAPATGTTTVPTLGAMGINVNSDGTLAIDTTTLNNVLSNSPQDVQSFFQGGSLNGFASNFVTRLNAFTDPGTGAFTVDLNSISRANSALTQEIGDFESGYIANQQQILTAMYTKAEIALQQLPTQMAQIQAELGNNTNNKG